MPNPSHAETLRALIPDYEAFRQTDDPYVDALKAGAEALETVAGAEQALQAFIRAAKSYSVAPHTEAVWRLAEAELRRRLTLLASPQEDQHERTPFLTVLVEVAWRTGYDAGFNASGEGWNAEWPFGSSTMSADKLADRRKRYEEDKDSTWQRQQDGDPI